MPRLAPQAEWTKAVQQIEDLGYDAVSVSDHFTDGWEMEPLTAMACAAQATTTLRILSLVLATDYRHPVQTHKALATLDILSGGRVEMGFGAGWKKAEYDAAGYLFLPHRQRLERFQEAITVICGLFADGPLTFDGGYYRVDGLEGLPRSVQRPHPPLLIGGFGEQLFTYAAQTADIVGFFPRGDLAAIPSRVVTARLAAEAVGRDPEFQLSCLAVHLTDVTETGWRSSLLPAGDHDSPAVLIGTVDECIAQLEDARDRYGFSYFNLGGPPEAAAPLVERLADQ